MKRIIRAIDRINQVIGLTAAHLYMICACITLYEVVMRYFFNAPTQWAFEIVMVVCASAWLLSAGYVTMRQNHIAITVLYQISKGRVRWCLDTFIHIVSILALGALTYAVWTPALHAVNVMEKSGSAFNAPGPMLTKVLLAFAAGAYTLQSIVNLIKQFGDYDSSGKPKEETVVSD